MIADDNKLSYDYIADVKKRGQLAHQARLILGKPSSVVGSKFSGFAKKLKPASAPYKKID